MNGTSVQIGNCKVGGSHPPYIVAEIGINHNGELENALSMIQECADAEVNAVKFQKRTVDVVYTPEELARSRNSRFGATNGDLKRGLELDRFQYEQIASHCGDWEIAWTASCWDQASVDFIDAFNPPFHKVASPCLTDHDLLRHIRSKGRPIVMSTGMSDLHEIEQAVTVTGTDNLILLHCVSAYPARYRDLNLRFIQTLRDRYGVPVGYSSHELGEDACAAAVALGACMIEKHVTLDPQDWGSDQRWSMPTDEVQKLVDHCLDVHRALGQNTKPGLLECEVPARDKLRRFK